MRRSLLLCFVAFSACPLPAVSEDAGGAGDTLDVRIDADDPDVLLANDANANSLDVRGLDVRGLDVRPDVETFDVSRPDVVGQDVEGADVFVSDKPEGPRVSRGLIALFSTLNGNGNLVDRSAVNPALTLQSAQNLQEFTQEWQGSGIKLLSLCSGTGTVEIWVDIVSDGRLFDLGGMRFSQNQNTVRYQDTLGAEQGPGITRGLHHIVLTRANGSTDYYLDGEYITSFATGSGPACAGADLSVGEVNVLNAFKVVGFYRRKISADEIRTNFEYGSALVSRVGNPELRYRITGRSPVASIPNGRGLIVGEGELTDGTLFSANVVYQNPLPTHDFAACVNEGALSVEAWVTPELASINGGGPKRIVMSGDNTMSNQQNFILGHGSGNGSSSFSARLYTSLGSVDFRTENGIAQTNKLTHLLFVYENGGAFQFYIDGQPVSGNNYNGNSGGNLVFEERSFLLGRDPSSDNRNFSGLIHESTVFCRALNADDAERNYLAGPAGHVSY